MKDEATRSIIMSQRGETAVASWRVVMAGALCWLAAAEVGCAGKDTRPKYSPPNLAADQVATLKANNDYWIAEVDGARIDEPGLKIVVQPGNTVRLQPGERTIVVK